MALFKFVEAMLAGRPIDICNTGAMAGNFTYVAELVWAIRLLVDLPPMRPDHADQNAAGDSLSGAGPYRVVNIGNSEKVPLLDFIDAIEAELGIKAVRNYMPLQMGDASATWADTALLQRLKGCRPQTNFKDGITQFIAWFRDYYRKKGQVSKPATGRPASGWPF